MRLRFILIVTMSFGAYFIHHACFPGLLDADASNQFHQALAFHFDDWHPPIMAFVWSYTNMIVPGPEGFFLLEILLYWLTFLLVGLRLISDLEPTPRFYYRYLI